MGLSSPAATSIGRGGFFLPEITFYGWQGTVLRAAQVEQMCLKATIAAFVVASMVVFSAEATDRLVTGGIVRGETLPHGDQIFRAIPYAAPPVGELRWTPPAAVRPWSGIWDSRKPGPPCVQRSYGWNAADAAAGREDCLYLSIHSPPHGPTACLPVMVFIHGGANRAGSGTGFVESAIVRRDIVLVTMQYRLGVFGFLSAAALTAESPQHASGNYGLMDQLAALKWVKANIAAFGGDPDNVTLFGHSAGGQDVGLLMLSPDARGLFHKAILQSGTPGFGVPPRSLAENEKIGTDLLRLMNLPEGPDGLKALRLAPGEALLDATDRLLPPRNVDASFIWMQAVVDGWIVPDTPARLLAEGKQAPVPMIIGNSVREFTVAGARESPRRWVEEIFDRNAKRAFAYYGYSGAEPPADDPVLGSIVDRISTDVIFRCPANWVAGRQLSLTPRVWRYQLEIAKPGLPQPAVHGSELPFVFDEPPPAVGDAQWPPLASYWINFAKTGDPNGEGLPSWPALGQENTYIAFTADGLRLGRNLGGGLCGLLANP